MERKQAVAFRASCPNPTSVHKEYGNYDGCTFIQSRYFVYFCVYMYVRTYESIGVQNSNMKTEGERGSTSNGYLQNATDHALFTAWLSSSPPLLSDAPFWIIKMPSPLYGIPHLNLSARLGSVLFPFHPLS